jgi:ankyrin repeat protein
VVELLLENGAHIDAKNKEGWNSLMKGKYYKLFILLQLLNLF